jgi:hypothetical protein
MVLRNRVETESQSAGKAVAAAKNCLRGELKMRPEQFITNQRSERKEGEAFLH